MSLSRKNWISVVQNNSLPEISPITSITHTLKSSVQLDVNYFIRMSIGENPSLELDQDNLLQFCQEIERSFSDFPTAAAAESPQQQQPQEPYHDASPQWQNLDPPTPYLVPQPPSTPLPSAQITEIPNEPTTTTNNNNSNKCPVCVNGETGRHTYYGGKACHSCRGFFRRSVQNNHHELFRCVGSGDCVIESKSRKSCQRCRFRRCVDLAGLQMSMVLSVDERRKRLIKRTRKGSEAEVGTIGGTVAKVEKVYMVYVCTLSMQY